MGHDNSLLLARQIVNKGTRAGYHRKNRASTRRARQMTNEEAPMTNVAAHFGIGYWDLVIRHLIPTLVIGPCSLVIP
jgi:hypothetical protein